MTKQEIIENNLLISEFTGSFTHPNDSNWMIFNPGGHCYPKDKAKYHKSYDWLIPVVEKIEKLGYFVMINKWTSVYTGTKDNRIEITSVEGKSKITNTYIAVVEFIKWYNTQK